MILTQAEGVQNHLEPNHQIAKLDVILRIGRPCGIRLRHLLHLEMAFLKAHHSRWHRGTVQLNLDLGVLVENLSSWHPV